MIMCLLFQITLFATSSYVLKEYLVYLAETRHPDILYEKVNWKFFLCQNYSGGWTTPAGPYPRQEIIQGYFPRANWFSSSAYFFNTITRCAQIIEWISNILKPSSLISLWLAEIVWFYIISFPNKVINQLVDFFNMVFRYWDQRCFAQKFRDNKTKKTLYNLNTIWIRVRPLPFQLFKVPWIDLQLAFSVAGVS